VADELPSYKKAREFIGSVEWKFAKTMPGIPHWYTVRAWAPDGKAYEDFVKLIWSDGSVMRWGRSTRPYLDLDGWRYWTMTLSLADNAIVNREKIEGSKAVRL